MTRDDKETIAVVALGVAIILGLLTFTIIRDHNGMNRLEDHPTTGTTYTYE